MIGELSMIVSLLAKGNTGEVIQLRLAVNMVALGANSTLIGVIGPMIER